MSVKEIERKFLVDKPPTDLPDGVNIIQGYVAVSEDGTEVRLRNKAGKYYLTVKGGGGLIRSEGEIEIDAASFDRLWPFTVGRRIEKRRYTLRFASSTFELDIYSGTLRGLMVVEVEFPSIQQSQDFSPPLWFGREVTADPHYKNKSLAILGRPC